jgi:hypothetical protein
VFEDDVSSLGYKIDVFQESINKMIPEFLVNYNYLNRVMENYGFRLVSREEAHDMGLPEGSGLFSELYSYMNEEIKQFKSKRYDYGDAFKMTAYEKKISFLNRYFIYKKIRQVNTTKITLEDNNSVLNELEIPEKETLAPPKKKPTKIPKKKLLIIDEE